MKSESIVNDLVYNDVSDRSMVHCDLADRDIRLNPYSRGWAARLHYRLDRVQCESGLSTALKFKAQKPPVAGAWPSASGGSLAVMAVPIIRIAAVAVIDLAQWHFDLADISIRNEPLILHDMERVCALCEHKRECDRDLAAGTSAEHYQGYCLNAPTIESVGA
jgi:hypothetical protein